MTRETAELVEARAYGSLAFSPEMILGNPEFLLSGGDLLFEPFGILGIARCWL